MQREHPNWTQQKIAEAVGCSQQYVNKVITTKDFESKESVVIPNHLTASEAKADFRKLPQELQEKVAAKEVSLNAAAIAAAYEKAKAKERQGTRTDLQHSGNVSGKFSDRRDAIGARVGVSGRTYEKFEQAKKRKSYYTKNCGTDTEVLIKVIRQEVERQRRVKQAETQAKKEEPIGKKISPQVTSKEAMVQKIVPQTRKDTSKLASHKTAELFNTNRTYVKTAHEDLA